MIWDHRVVKSYHKAKSIAIYNNYEHNYVHKWIKWKTTDFFLLHDMHAYVIKQRPQSRFYSQQSSTFKSITDIFSKWCMNLGNNSLKQPSEKSQFENRKSHIITE